MAQNSIYSEIYIQLILAVSNRKCLIKPSWENNLLKFISDHLSAKNTPVLAINGAEDHIHILLRGRVSISLEDLVRDIKFSSAGFVNSEGFMRSYFSWQEGYGAFSYNRWDLEVVKKKIQDQKFFHKRTSFKEEFIHLLKEFEIPYDEKDLFRWIIEPALVKI